MKSHRFTPVHLTSPSDIINSNDKIFCLGSCFAENIGKKLVATKMKVCTNPTGILYNPASISHVLDMLTNRIIVDESEIKNRGEINFHYSFHSDMNALGGEKCLQKINTNLASGSNSFENSKWVIVTLGTSIVHVLKETKEIVANCHKMDRLLFDKKMLSVKQSFSFMDKVLPNEKQIILTVSPIRHTKEGAIENQRSKSRLIEVANLLAEQRTNIHYFPAYEIMMDELRDYRYYDTDMIHPSDEAVEIIWSKFVESFFSPNAKEKLNKMQKLAQAISHRPVHENSIGYKNHCNSLLETIAELSVSYPTINFSKEIEEINKRLEL